VCSKQ